MVEGFDCQDEALNHYLPLIGSFFAAREGFSRRRYGVRRLVAASRAGACHIGAGKPAQSKAVASHRTP